MIPKVIKQVIKKAYKAGYFHSFTASQDHVNFQDVHNVVYSFNLCKNPSIPNLGTLAIGRFETWTERGLTYESEYQSMGDIKRARFIPYHIQDTDNPDYILRASISSLFPNF